MIKMYNLFVGSLRKFLMCCENVCDDLVVDYVGLLINNFMWVM